MRGKKRRHIAIPGESGRLAALPGKAPVLVGGVFKYREEKQCVIDCLEKNAGNRRATAKELGVSEIALWVWLRYYRLDHLPSKISKWFKHRYSVIEKGNEMYIYQPLGDKVRNDPEGAKKAIVQALERFKCQRKVAVFFGVNHMTLNRYVKILGLREVARNIYQAERARLLLIRREEQLAKKALEKKPRGRPVGYRKYTTEEEKKRAAKARRTRKVRWRKAEKDYVLRLRKLASMGEE